MVQIGTLNVEVVWYVDEKNEFTYLSLHFFTQMSNHWFYAKYQHKSSYFCWTFSRRKSLTLKNKIFKDENRFVQIHPKSLKWTSTVQCNIISKMFRVRNWMRQNAIEIQRNIDIMWTLFLLSISAMIIWKYIPANVYWPERTSI